MNDLVRKVRGTIEASGLLKPRDTVVIAVSGGPDSIALLHVLVALRSEYDLTLHVAHLNHQLRAEAAEDAEFVRGVALQLGIPTHIASVDVRAFATTQKLSLEEAGRQARYALFARTAAITHASQVATGHTRDDQVETVAMRILQGGSWTALAGIPVARPLGKVRVVRPLLEATRSEVLEYLRTRHLSWREDPSNRDVRVFRNWVRHAWLPALHAQFPQVGRLLWDLGSLTRDVDRLLEAAAAKTVAAARQTSTAMTFDLDALHNLPPDVVRRVVRLTAQQIGGTELQPRDVSVVGMLDVVSAKVGQEVPVGRCVLRRGYQTVEVTVAKPVSVCSYELPVPGRIDAVGFGVVVTAEVLDRSSVPPDVAGRSDGVYLDADAVGRAVVVRSWRHGDRVWPLGLGGSKKVHDIFVDKKVPRWQRVRVPLVTDANGQILWIVGHAIAEAAKVTPTSARVVQLRVSS